MTKLTLEQLNQLSDVEHADASAEENIWYIAYLWSILQDLSGEFEDQLQADYNKYFGETA